MKKTFWPFGILLVIVFGVLLLVALVYISLIQPNPNDNAYMQKYRDVEKNIDVLLSDSKVFLENYSVYLSANQKYTLQDELIPPYLIKAKKIEKTQQNIFLQTPSKLHLFLISKTKNQEIKILNYQVFATRYYDNDYKNKFDLLAEDTNLKSFDFAPQKQGRWKITLEITFLYHQKESKVYLQRDFIVKN